MIGIRSATARGVSLALVAMMMRMQDGLNLADANLGEQVQDVPGPEINQDGAVPVLENINVAGVAQHVKVGRDLRQPALRREMHRQGSGATGFCGFPGDAPASSAAISPAPALRRKSRRLTPNFSEALRFFIAIPFSRRLSPVRVDQ